MRLKTIYIFTLLFVPFLSKGQAGFITSPSGLKYRFFTQGSGTKPKQGDIVKFNFYLYSDKDSLLFPKRPPPLPQQALVNQSSYKGDIEEAFKMMSKGDSAMFLVSADSFYSGQDNMPVPKGTMLKATIKLVDIITPEAHALEIKQQKEQDTLLNAKYKRLEKKYLDGYILSRAPKAIKTDEGIYLVKEHKGRGALPQDSQTVIIRYTSCLLNEKPIDSGAGKVISFVMGRHEVIKGLEKGIALLNKGSKARLYIPSPFAYGKAGEGKTIPPYATIIYDVEVLEIK